MDSDDVADIFDSVFALEQEQYQVGQAEGMQDGLLKHHQQGFILGWQQACHVLQELGHIEGVLSSVLLNCKSEIDPRLHSQSTKLLETIRGWPEWEAAGEEEVERKLAVIHTKARHIFNRLKIPSRVIDRSVDGEF